MGDWLPWDGSTDQIIPFCSEPWSEILPGLFMGGHFSNDGERIRPVIVGSEFDAVFSAYHAFGHGPDDGVPHKRIRIPDGILNEADWAAVVGMVDALTAFTDCGNWEAKVLVRCQAGYNRSGLIVALYLLRLGFSADQAVMMIRNRRSEYALCNESFAQLIHREYEEMSR